ncbi:MAG: RluA family pseudouridine synthase [Spirochaetes bacterium]|nr:RluA family pseudouridine synthase [Spirochaetota bacterium]
MNIINTHIVADNIKEQRLSEYAIGLFVQLSSRNSVKKAIRKQELLLNGKPAETGRWIKEGDRIDLIESGLNPPKTYNLILEVIYEDNCLAVINKPSGIVVSANQFKTIENTLSGNLKKSDAIDVLKWPKPVHRLDSLTCGLLIVSKTSGAHRNISSQFENGTVKKIYKAVVHCTPPETGIIDNDIDGRYAYTEYYLLKTVPSLRNGSLSLVKLFPQTGRTHQLRIHMSGIGHPIVGDTVYGTKGNMLLHKGLFLASVAVSFNHPLSGKRLNFEINDPAKFHKLLEREERRWYKYNI